MLNYHTAFTSYKLISILSSRIARNIAFTAVVLFLSLLNFSLQAQTIGLLDYEEGVEDGYTFFAPMTYGEAYLIDNCGKKIHSWQTGEKPSYSGFVLEDGSYIMSVRLTSQFDPEFPSGILKRFDWDGNLIWEFNDFESDIYYHHDFAVMPNGNILVVVDKYLSEEEAIAAGRNPEYVDEYIVGTAIIEYEPLPESGAVEVWRWEIFDHLIQDIDADKENYGVVSENIGRIDINYATSELVLEASDWIHTNSICFHPIQNQILISNRNLSEIWVIDHSTTTEQAASNTGGHANKGGDIIYRWGNPAAYNHGSVLDQVLFSQHDAQWIFEPLENSGNIIFFNNNFQGGIHSQVGEIDPPYTAEDGYTDPGIEAYEPSEMAWSYTDSEFYSPNISGIQRQPNGNSLICQGNDGRFFEINSEGDQLWEYISPVNTFGPLAQFNEPSANSVFQIIKYPEDYIGFEGRDLTPGDPIELEFLDIECPVIVDPPDTTISIDRHESEVFWTYSDVDNKKLKVHSGLVGGEIIILNNLGQTVHSEIIRETITTIDLQRYSSGMYIAAYKLGTTILTTKFIHK